MCIFGINIFYAGKRLIIDIDFINSWPDNKLFYIWKFLITITHLYVRVKFNFSHPVFYIHINNSIKTFINIHCHAILAVCFDNLPFRLATSTKFGKRSRKAEYVFRTWIQTRVWS